MPQQFVPAPHLAPWSIGHKLAPVLVGRPRQDGAIEELLQGGLLLTHRKCPHERRVTV